MKLKWTTKIPLVIETPILVGVDILYLRDCGDNGAAAPLLRTGAGGKYFLTKRIGLGHDGRARILGIAQRKAERLCHVFDGGYAVGKSLLVRHNQTIWRGQLVPTCNFSRV